MSVEFLLNEFKDYLNKEAIFWNSRSYSYDWLLNQVNHWQQEISYLKHGSVVSIEGDFSPNSIALLLALINRSCIIVPLNYSQKIKNKKKYEIAQVETLITINENDEVEINNFNVNAEHDFYNYLKEVKQPGLVLFTSGTSGEPKAAVHNFSNLLEKFKVKRKALKTLNFLLFDHWGGLNTMFHTLSNGGSTIAINDRSPDTICKLVEDYKIEVLPASPTFLNLLLISEAYKRYNLSSLNLITYGTEPMPESTLTRLHSLFPKIKLHQTYGLIELGVLRSKSKEDNSLWVKVGGEGFQTRIVDNILQIKAESAMIGYLNAPSPFTEDGWFITGDSVETDGDYIKILGRKSEIINVGGEKVYPAEVENVILEINNV